MPFLLPMMFQLGFGLSAAQSGLITFVSSVGSLAMRLVAPGILRRLGFRAVLVWIGLDRHADPGTQRGLPTERTADRADLRRAAAERLLPVAAIFMAYNTIAYADVPRSVMSTATQLLHDVPAGRR